MSQTGHAAAKSPTSHLHAMNLVVALLAGIISVTGGIITLKNNFFAGPAFGSLQGIVRDERIAKPLKLAFVEVSDLAGAVINTATTDDEGHYLIKPLKAGNYVVKFNASLHKTQTKAIKIEKNLESSINADLFPEAHQPDLSPIESPVEAPKNIQARYTPEAPYSAVSTSAASGYQVSQNIPSAPTPPAVYSQEESMDPIMSSPHTRFRRYPRHRHPLESGDGSSEVSQSTSQGSVLAQAGAQLLQAWLSKKSEEKAASSD